MTKAIKLTVDSRIENVPLVGGAVRGIARALSVDEIDGYHLELCVVEAFTNVTRHAYSLVAGYPVEVDISCVPDRITIRICDEGSPLDRMTAELPDFDPLKRETLPESGMGLFLINSLMDDVRYESIGGVNIMTMSKHLSA